LAIPLLLREGISNSPDSRTTVGGVLLAPLLPCLRPLYTIIISESALHLRQLNEKLPEGAV
jgi:hypothetical protein